MFEAIKNLCLVVLSVLSILLGTILLWVVGIHPTAPSEWIACGVGVLLLFTPLLWVHGLWKYYFHSVDSVPTPTEWEWTECPSCWKQREVHTGHGVCYGCLVEAPEELPAAESWKGKVVRVRFTKRDGTLRLMEDFVVLHIDRYRSGKVLVSGLEATDAGWQPRGFCQDQLLDLRIKDTLSERELREAYDHFKWSSNPNNV
jgi:hypothetical protein